MCNLCGAPTKGNHYMPDECLDYWRERAGQMEAAAMQERKDADILRGRAARAVAVLDDLRNALASHLNATADCDADRAVRILEGRA